MNGQAPQPGKAKRPKRAPSGFWRKVREPLTHSRFAKRALAGVMARALRFIRLTNPCAAGSMVHPPYDQEPFIIALWHGQHFLISAFYYSRRKLVAMVSRSADAELNALVLERFGVEIVRGSGGRRRGKRKPEPVEKGGAKALVLLKRALDAGHNVAMICDVPNGTPRDAGLGIILLARISGRPILPVAVATSRRKVLEKSWDKSTINLPFGRSALRFGQLIWVPADADEAAMETKRRELTVAMNETTDAAYALVDCSPAEPRDRAP